MKHLITVALIIRTYACAAELPGAAGASRLEFQPEIPTGKPTVAISREGTQVKITFSGTLQSADGVTGPWTDVLDAASPLMISTSGQPRFFQTRQPESIFASRAVVALTMTGPLQTHFDLAFAGTPDGIIPPKRAKPYFDGALMVAGVEIPVSARVRGNSSLQECPFPKMKFKISREHRAGTPFFDAREVKVGTHCAEGGRGNIGRLRDETAAFREALAYEALGLMRFIAPRVRRARIEYRDTTPTGGSSAGGWQVTRDALILDDIEVVAERLSGRALDDEEISVLSSANFDEQLVTDLQFFHVLLGNWDYALSADGRGLWNTEVIELNEGKLVPVAGDFDLSSWVTEVVRSSAPRDYHPELGEVERQARHALEQIQLQASGPVFVAANTRFLEQRDALESLVREAVIDEPGRSNALRHVRAFFEALASVML